MEVRPSASHGVKLAIGRLNAPGHRSMIADGYDAEPQCLGMFAGYQSIWSCQRTIRGYMEPIFHGSSHLMSLVARTGFEPVVSALRGRCPWPLDERATEDQHVIYELTDGMLIIYRRPQVHVKTASPFQW